MKTRREFLAIFALAGVTVSSIAKAEPRPATVKHVIYDPKSRKHRVAAFTDNKYRDFVRVVPTYNKGDNVDDYANEIQEIADWCKGTFVKTSGDPEWFKVYIPCPDTDRNVYIVAFPGQLIVKDSGEGISLCEVSETGNLHVLYTNGKTWFDTDRKSFVDKSNSQLMVDQVKEIQKRSNTIAKIVNDQMVTLNEISGKL